MSGGGRATPERWLVTGAGGQLGRSFLAVAGGCGIVAEGAARSRIDVTDLHRVEAAVEAAAPDVVLNAAAFTAVDACEEREDEARRVNALGPENLARACEGRALLVHLSTEYVFDGRAAHALDEDAPTAPLNAYGRTKLAGERAVRSSGCEHLIVRTQWLFGPGRNFVRSVLDQAGRGGPLRVVRDQVGRPTWTGALARSLIEAVRRGLRGTLHLACGGVASWHDLACEVVREGARRRLCAALEVAAIESAALDRAALRPAHAVLALERARAAGVSLPHWREALVGYLDAEEEGRDA